MLVIFLIFQVYPGIVIDPSGKITDSDAIRPGDPNIKELLKLID